MRCFWRHLRALRCWMCSEGRENTEDVSGARDEARAEAGQISKVPSICRSSLNLHPRCERLNVQCEGPRSLIRTLTDTFAFFARCRATRSTFGSLYRRTCLRSLRMSAVSLQRVSPARWTRLSRANLLRRCFAIPRTESSTPRRRMETWWVS